jgi:hypothetical protein
MSKISEKKQALIDAKNASPLEVGETIVVSENVLTNYKKDALKDRKKNAVIMQIDGDTITIRDAERTKNYDKYKISTSDSVSMQLFYVGANPFNEKYNSIHPIAFTIESILFNLNILGEKSSADKFEIKGTPVKSLNWNPFVYNGKGEKEYYQRPFVWTLEDNQLLIQSIYEGIDCGKILVRARGFEELRKIQATGETELAFHDLVDGKQRLNAVRGFIMGEYPDMQGNYYNDLSFRAQHLFTNHQLFSYAEMPEETKDEEVIQQFLKLNFAGVPQSKEHIEFVRSIQNRI